MRYRRQVEEGEKRLSPSEWAAKAVLTKLGLTVDEVPRTSAKTADFVVTGDDPAYLVEVASRRLSEAIYEKPVDIEQTRDPKVMEWLKAAGNQCRTVDPHHAKLWFVWGAAEGPIGADAQIERINNALYGVRTVIDAMPPHNEFTIYYARPSLFECHPEIDAVILFAPDVGIGVCPNEFSPRFDAVMKSRLAAQLACVAPRERVKHGCVVPNSIDRHDEVEVLRHVQSAIGIYTLAFTFCDVQSVSGVRVQLSKLKA